MLKDEVESEDPEDPEVNLSPQNHLMMMSPHQGQSGIPQVQHPGLGNRIALNPKATPQHMHIEGQNEKKMNTSDSDRDKSNIALGSGTTKKKDESQTPGRQKKQVPLQSHQPEEGYRRDPYGPPPQFYEYQGFPGYGVQPPYGYQVPHPQYGHHLYAGYPPMGYEKLVHLPRPPMGRQFAPGAYPPPYGYQERPFPQPHLAHPEYYEEYGYGNERLPPMQGHHHYAVHLQGQNIKRPKHMVPSYQEPALPHGQYNPYRYVGPPNQHFGTTIYNSPHYQVHDQFDDQAYEYYNYKQQKVGPSRLQEPPHNYHNNYKEQQGPVFASPSQGPQYRQQYQNENEGYKMEDLDYVDQKKMYKNNPTHDNQASKKNVKKPKPKHTNKEQTGTHIINNPQMSAPNLQQAESKDGVNATYNNKSSSRGGKVVNSMRKVSGNGFAENP